jgi:hypothetical protein
MDWEKVQMMAEQNTLYLMLKEQGLAISFELFKALCDKAKEAAKEAVEQEQRCDNVLKTQIIMLEDLFEKASYSCPIKICVTLPGAMYRLNDDERNQFIKWAKEKVKTLKQQLKEQ